MMSSVVLDSQTIEKLQQAGGPVEIRNAAGDVVGYFTPRFTASLYESVECPISEEELDRRAQEGGGRTLEEIFRDLERRT